MEPKAFLSGLRKIGDLYVDEKLACARLSDLILSCRASWLRADGSRRSLFAFRCPAEAENDFIAIDTNKSALCKSSVRSGESVWDHLPHSALTLSDSLGRDAHPRTAAPALSARPAHQDHERQTSKCRVITGSRSL
jgi:hypothetical protein